MYSQPPPVRPMNSFAVGAFASALLGVFTCGISGIVAIVLGLIARSQCAQRDERGAGLAIAAMVIGGAFVLFFVFGALAMIQYANECPSGC